MAQDEVLGLSEAGARAEETREGLGEVISLVADSSSPVGRGDVHISLAGQGNEDVATIVSPADGAVQRLTKGAGPCLLRPGVVLHPKCLLWVTMMNAFISPSELNCS